MRLTLKQFLSNSPDETGFIIITASSPRVVDMEESSWYRDNLTVNAEVQIGDCSQKAYLNFDVKDGISLEKRIAKLNVMIDNLTLLRNTLPALWDDAKSNVEEYKKLELIKQNEEKESGI